MNAVPQEIVNAVNNLLKPYGANYNPNSNDEKGIKKYLTLTEAVEYSGMQKWTLARKIKSGELKASKLSPAKGSTVLILVDDLDEYIQKHMRVK